MSLETCLEDFPMEVELKDGFQCTIRPLEKSDEKQLFDYFQQVPETERLFIKHRIDDPAIIRSWCNHIDPLHKLPLLALHDGRVIGLATLHQNQGGWKRHIGRVSVLVLPSHRGKGLARKLVEMLVDLARHAGLESVEAEFIARQESAIKMFGILGFEPLVTLDGYVIDMHGNRHNYMLMTFPLKTPEEYAGVG